MEDLVEDVLVSFKFKKYNYHTSCILYQLVCTYIQIFI